MAGSVAPPLEPQLTEPQIDVIVTRYLREMARFEKTAAAVAERLRRELRAEGHLRYLLSFRAKHPDDLRENSGGSRKTRIPGTPSRNCSRTSGTS